MKITTTSYASTTKPYSLTSYIALATSALLVATNFVLSPQCYSFYTILMQHFHILSVFPVPLGKFHDFFRPVEATPWVLTKSYAEGLYFFGSFILVFALYIWAIQRLPAEISIRFILYSTALLGIVYMSIPIITSQDILSYIAYARMAVIYHLNPLTNSPAVIHDDYVYGFLYWINQPSIYGPTWIFIISILQRVMLLFGFNYVLSMELMLRLFSLCMHLGSTLLIWCISARLADSACSSKGCYYPLAHRFQVQRLRATLAFAWNPFLLFESSVNAHIDVTLLCLLLLGIWFLFAVEEGHKLCYPLVALVFGVIACLKITCLILLPGLLLFLWTYYASSVSYWKRIGMLLLTGAISLGVIVGFYIPFWENGAVLNILKVAPTMSRDINSVYDFLVGIYDWIRGLKMHDPSLDHGSLFEIYTHNISTIIFCVGYCVIVVRSLLLPRVIKSQPALLSWLALVWLLFCVLGSPWFWPWYCVILFGLFALLEVYYGYNAQVPFVFGRLNTTLFGLALSISLFSIYCFGNLAQVSDQLQLSWLGGVWIWGVPCLVLICISRYFHDWFKGT